MSDETRKEEPVESACPKCGTGKMKRSNFRTGQVGNKGGPVRVCDKCGHRTGATG